MRLNGHKVLITGGTRGIGAALGRMFLRNMSEVISVARSDTRERKHMGGEFIACDLSKGAQREKLKARLSQDHPDISVLINNAAIQKPGRFHDDYNYRDYKVEIETNISAVVDLTDALLPILQTKPEAAIVNVSSALAIQPQQNIPVYCASKAFLHSFSVALRYQLEASNVRVFELMPSLVDTEMHRGLHRAKMSPTDLARVFQRGWARNEFEISAGKISWLSLSNRISPKLARLTSRRY